MRVCAITAAIAPRAAGEGQERAPSFCRADAEHCVKRGLCTPIDLGRWLNNVL
jgi:hypothetical protein